MSATLSSATFGPSNPENDQKIANAGRLSKRSIEISIGIFFGIAALSVLLRTVRRLATLKRLKLDDAFLWLALVCLSAATGIFYHILPVGMIVEALTLLDHVIIPIPQIPILLNSMAYIDSFLCLIWTCTFSVKFSFLALFRHLIRDISPRITLYFWSVVGYTVLLWMFMIAEAFILCPYQGMQSATCFPRDNYTKTLGLTILITILDILSDILIASIPILILKKSQMKLSQKMSLALFLCLSIVMALFALARCAGIKDGSDIDYMWEMYWQYMEGCIACIMASITPFRTLFTSLLSRSSREKAGPPSNTFIEHILKRRKKANSQDWIEMNDQQSLPRPPGALLSGLRTFVRRNNRTDGESTVMITTTFSVDEESWKGASQHHELH